MSNKYVTSFIITFLFIMLAKCKAQTTGNAVDLGLNIYWASCNIGANSPEDIGGYYAWGETDEKDYYGFNYAYLDSETSYHDIGTDISGSQYDVARVKWGGAWRMPTIDECKELVQKCTWTWVSQNGVNGALVTGVNGNSIFIPAGGRKYGDRGLRDFGTYGCYWSSTIESDNGYGHSSKMLLFYNNNQDVTDGRNRINGMPVRPVTNDPTGIVEIQNNKNTSIVYNLSGLRMATLKKGINIVDGYKIVIK